MNYQMVQNTTNSRWYTHFQISKDCLLTDESIVLLPLKTLSGFVLIWLPILEALHLEKFLFLEISLFKLQVVIKATLTVFFRGLNRHSKNADALKCCIFSNQSSKQRSARYVIELLDLISEWVFFVIKF